ncbi:MAG: hypothetical protein AAB217_16830, partial [Chloroflexota bacterium]
MRKQNSSPWKTASIISIVSIAIFASGLWRPVLAAFNYRPVNRPLLAHGPILHTTYTNFEGCVDTANTTARISDVGGGSIMLPAAFADDFNSAPLDTTTKWAIGEWTPNLPINDPWVPAISGGVLTVQNATDDGNDGAWVRSKSPYLFTHGVVEFTAEFGLGADQNIGFGSTGFAGNRLFLFSTRNAAGAYDGNLYARANNSGSEDNWSLGAIPTGVHRYRIEWT